MKAGPRHRPRPRPGPRPGPRLGPGNRGSNINHWEDKSGMTHSGCRQSTIIRANHRHKCIQALRLRCMWWDRNGCKQCYANRVWPSRRGADASDQHDGGNVMSCYIDMPSCYFRICCQHKLPTCVYASILTRVLSNPFSNGPCLFVFKWRFIYEDCNEIIHKTVCVHKCTTSKWFLGSHFSHELARRSADCVQFLSMLLLFSESVGVYWRVLLALLQMLNTRRTAVERMQGLLALSKWFVASAV